MFNEQYGLNRKDLNRMLMKTHNKETLKPQFEGYVIDKIKHLDTGEIEVRSGYNIVVNDCSRLIGALMKREPGYDGLLYWAVGRGSSDWDGDEPLPEEETSELVFEIYRKEIAAGNIVFLDNNGNETGSITRHLRITVTFDEEEANDELREFGLFGGNATSSSNSGLMINHKIHPVITKTSNIELERNLRITF